MLTYNMPYLAMHLPLKRATQRFVEQPHGFAPGAAEIITRLGKSRRVPSERSEVCSNLG